jgi:hypothetical protein
LCFFGFAASTLGSLRSEAAERWHTKARCISKGRTDCLKKKKKKKKKIRNSKTSFDFQRKFYSPSGALQRGLSAGGEGGGEMGRGYTVKPLEF